MQFKGGTGGGATWPMALAYAATITLFIALADVFFAIEHFPRSEPRLNNYATLVNRVAWYEQHRSDYNLIFLGDSRTYCGIHPDFIDPLLGTSSLNLSVLAHWFPTQLPQVEHIAPLIPKNTTVVWSVGVLNFITAGSVGRAYPVGIANTPRYLWWGVQRKGLWDNLAYFNPALFILVDRENVKQRLDRFLNEIFTTASAAEGNTGGDDPYASEVQAIKAKYRNDPRVSSVDPQPATGRLNSVVVLFKRGGHYRIEMDQEYFVRKKGEALGGAPGYAALPIDPASLRLFEEMLAIFKANNIKLVVNEMEEAPFMYSDVSWHRRFMRDVVEKRVRELGFSYVRIDFDRLSDDDYFDYNHLNSRGVARFTPLLADQLRPYLSSR